MNDGNQLSGSPAIESTQKISDSFSSIEKESTLIKTITDLEKSLHELRALHRSQFINNNLEPKPLPARAVVQGDEVQEDDNHEATLQFLSKAISALWSKPELFTFDHAIDIAKLFKQLDSRLEHDSCVIHEQEALEQLVLKLSKPDDLHIEKKTAIASLFSFFRIPKHIQIIGSTLKTWLLETTDPCKKHEWSLVLAEIPCTNCKNVAAKHLMELLSSKDFRSENDASWELEILKSLALISGYEKFVADMLLKHYLENQARSVEYQIQAAIILAQIKENTSSAALWLSTTALDYSITGHNRFAAEIALNKIDDALSQRFHQLRRLVKDPNCDLMKLIPNIEPFLSDPLYQKECLAWLSIKA